MVSPLTRSWFGQAAALDGAASALGLGMKMGLEAAFAEINKAGGVKGRKLELKSVDDGYEPTKSIEAVKKLLEEDKVFAIAGAVVLRPQPPLSRSRPQRVRPLSAPSRAPSSCASPTNPWC